MPEELAEYGIEPAEMTEEKNESVHITLRLNAEENEKLSGILKHYCIANRSQFFKNCIDQVHNKIKKPEISGQ